MPERYDCIVIGSGPGGYVAAIRAAQLGMKTAVVEKDRVGGRCLNYACIPAKAVLRVADILSEVDEADEFGIEIEGRSVDFSKVSARREKVIKTLTGGVGGLFKKNKVDVIKGVDLDIASHEFIVTLKRQARELNVTAMDFAKRLLDYGFHAPTTYFPLLVPECLLIEPTETESKETLDAFVTAMSQIQKEADQDPGRVTSAPHTMPARRLDDVRAAKQLDLRWKPTA